MEAWEDISVPGFSGGEDEAIWQKFGSQFGFSISTTPAIFEPSPSVTYFIGPNSDQPDHFDKLLTDLDIRMLAAFRRCVPADGWLYALDAYHPSYRFRPHIPFDAAEGNNWRVSVFPNGDYHIFLAPDLRFGLFGHPWEQTMCIFGEELLTALEDDPPLLFSTVIRENRQQVRPIIHGRFFIAGEGQQYRNAVGPRDMRLATFIDQVETSGYTFSTGRAQLISIEMTEDIVPTVRSESSWKRGCRWRLMWHLRQHRFIPHE